MRVRNREDKGWSKRVEGALQNAMRMLSVEGNKEVKAVLDA